MRTKHLSRVSLDICGYTLMSTNQFKHEYINIVTENYFSTDYNDNMYCSTGYS